jgi:PAP2 superfamily
MPNASASLAASSAPSSRFFDALRKSNSAHGIYWAILAAYYAAYFIIRGITPNMMSTNFLLVAVSFVAISMPVMLLCLAIMRFYHIARHVKPKHPIAALLKDLKQFLTDRQRMAHGLPMVLIMFLFMFVFDQLKANIPIFNPFSWDAALMQADQFLHFGRQPWQWLQPVFGHVPVTFLININYNAWFVVMWTMWVFFAFADRASETRTRFFLTFMVSWIIGGGLLAIYFSSVGPCFYGRLGLAPDPYAELLVYLHGANQTVPIWAVSVQDALWQGYADKSLLDGISGMPSMHNATALLFALAGFKVNRTAGYFLLGHALLIFLGSIHLAWHYAIDTYVAWALTLVLWFALAPVARWWESRSVQRDFARSLEQAV